VARGACCRRPRSARSPSSRWQRCPTR
jgi:hypothetical protein